MSHPRILVVDDEPAMLYTTRRVLGEQYEVAVARTPSEAVGLLHTFKPDLAILDIRMPEMDGFELMGRLKALRPDLDLIVMTGSVTEADSKLIRAIRGKAFYFIQKPFDREVLHTLVARCLELRRLGEANRRHLARLEGELEEARAFQQSLLPAGESCVEGITVCARYEPCQELGGDFFDYAPAGKGRATVLVADVSGHGAGAAMLTGIVKAAFHAAQGAQYEPRAVVTGIAGGIRSLADSMLVTAICARLSCEELFLEYVGAGHPPGILWGEDRAPSLLEPTGPIISPAFPSSQWEQRRLRLHRSDRLLLYTDGILEAQGEEGEFGAGRLLALIRSRQTRQTPRTGGSRADRAAEPTLLGEILTTLRRFVGGRPASDDMTLLEAALSD